MARYSIEQRIIKYVKGYAFLKFTRNLSNKRRKQFGYRYNSGIRYSKADEADKLLNNSSESKFVTKNRLR